MADDEQRATASPSYALDRLRRAIEAVAAAGDAGERARAEAKVARWTDVVAGMASGTLTVGSRTPVAGTPAWVTLEVAHGGFATGRYLAEAPLRLDERATLRAVPADVPGTTDRERLNLWYLSDDGVERLLAALREGRYRIELPEDAALMVVAWLLDNGHHALALDLVAELRPLLHRLRLTPRLERAPQPPPSAVRLLPVGEVRGALRAARVRPPIAAMREAYRVWNPLYDRLVALWCDTVDGDLPHLVDGAVAGGWPCRNWPADWAERRAAWLADYAAATAEHTDSRAHEHPKGNFARLRTALEACERDSTALSPRDVGWVRRALANTVTRHGAPGTERRAALRAVQAAVAARPTHAAVAHLLARRLEAFPDEGGISSLDDVTMPAADESPDVPPGLPVPAHLVAKVARALEAPVDELVALGVIPSPDVLARVLPQVTAPVVAAGVEPPELAALYARTYAAFRRRRSLLLLNLESQVRFGELPWVRALEAFRTARSGDALAVARHATMVSFGAFPHAILPNTLLRELRALAGEARIDLPLVDELASDIFTGSFAAKWRDAAVVASALLDGSLYARYYDLPPTGSWPAHRPLFSKWGKATADDFGGVCAARARAAGAVRARWSAAWNGSVIEQSQVLTTQNLAALVHALDLRAQLGPVAPELADRAFRWALRRLAQLGPHPHARLVAVKNIAYAWRQAVFFLSFADEPAQRAAVARLADAVGDGVLSPAVAGLAHVVAGGRFDESGGVPGGGRRLLGWTTGTHWLLDRAGAAAVRPG